MDPGPLPVQVRALIVLVSAALNAGDDPLATVRAVVRPPPSPEVVAAIVDLLDSPEVARQPGEPGLVLIARIEAVTGHAV